MAQVLSDTWTDTDGDRFTSELTAAYDAQFNINAITNDFIVDQLTQDRPILYANTHHAMVVVSVDYIPGPQPTVINAGVLDPWPYSPAYHPLSPAEIVPIQRGGQMTFLAAADVT